MFQRSRAAKAVSATPPEGWQDKALPAIPFAPEWAQSSAAFPDPRIGVATTRPESESFTLIFAEGDTASRELIRGLARSWGYRVLSTTNGHSALATLAVTSGAAIALVNRDMVGMSGIEFCQAARATEKPLYVILVTERSGAEQLDEALSAGADDYLITPFDADELRARLRVGARIIALEADLATKARELERISAAPRVA